MIASKLSSVNVSYNQEKDKLPRGRVILLRYIAVWLN